MDVRDISESSLCLNIISRKDNRFLEGEPEILASIYHHGKMTFIKLVRIKAILIFIITFFTAVYEFYKFNWLNNSLKIPLSGKILLG